VGDLRTAQFGYGGIGRVMIDMLTLEMIFLVTLFAIGVNIRWE
jgi:hypothetical protein